MAETAELPGCRWGDVAVRTWVVAIAVVGLGMGPLGCTSASPADPSPDGSSDDSPSAPGLGPRETGGRVVAGDGNEICGAVQVGAKRVSPKVTVILDQSSSMDMDFPSSDGSAPDSRWNRMRDALVGPTGIITELEDLVQFGLSMYSASGGVFPYLPAPGTECPMINAVPAAPANHAAIQSTYLASGPLGDTPTGDAVAKILQDYLALPDPDPDPPVFILATDGDPDRCEKLNHWNDAAKTIPDTENDRLSRQESVDAVRQAFETGILTYVIGVGQGSVSLAHLQELANAGLGRGPGAADAPYWEAGDDQGLREALRNIVGSVLSCEVDLDGRIDVPSACAGTVTLNGTPISCDDPNGWRVVDEDTIELLGTSCEGLKAEFGATVDASFPCYVLVV